jgi:hypothetical protein
LTFHEIFPLEILPSSGNLQKLIIAIKALPGFFLCIFSSLYLPPREWGLHYNISQNTFFRKAHFQEVVTNFNPCPEQRDSFNPCCKTRLFLQAAFMEYPICSAKLPIPCFQVAQLHIVQCSHPLHHFPEFHFANLPTQHRHIVIRLANFHV